MDLSTEKIGARLIILVNGSVTVAIDNLVIEGLNLSRPVADYTLCKTETSIISICDVGLWVVFQ